MKIVVPVKLVPDLVEEFSIDPDGKSVDMTWVRLVLNEFDNHAIEQAILLKEKFGAEVIVIAPDVDGAEDTLFTAAAAGADRLIRLTGMGERPSSHRLADACAAIAAELHPDLILTGVQAHDDLDGQLGPLLAEKLELPYVGYIAGLSITDGSILAQKEFPGGLVANMSADLPVVIGIQAAESPPRYIAFSRVRQAKNSSEIEEIDSSGSVSEGMLEISRMSLPERGERAEILTGSLEEISVRLAELFGEHGAL